MKTLLEFITQPVSLTIIIILASIIAFALYNHYRNRALRESSSPGRNYTVGGGKYNDVTEQKTSPFAP